MVKIVRKDKLTDEQRTDADLLKEAQSLAVLDHPNIVRIHEIFQDSKRLYLIMDYAKGGPLFERLSGLKHFSEKEASNVVFQIL
jgi:calcium-dependent protein kinase